MVRLYLYAVKFYRKPKSRPEKAAKKASFYPAGYIYIFYLIGDELLSALELELVLKPKEVSAAAETELEW
jgi:hypothetical protein